MTDAVRLLALWLTPALWLAMPALILARGSEGLWVGLALTVAPLIALIAPGGAGRRSARRGALPPRGAPRGGWDLDLGQCRARR